MLAKKVETATKEADASALEALGAPDHSRILNCMVHLFSGFLSDDVISFEQKNLLDMRKTLRSY